MANQFNVNSGFTLSGNSVVVGEEEAVQSGGASISATISSGGTEIVFSGGVASGVVVSNGGTLNVNDFNGGATAIGTVVSSGGSAFVGDGDAASGTVVQQGGTLVIAGTTVPGGGFGATVFGDEEVSFQGQTTSDTIENGGTANVQLGASIMDAVVAVGGSLNINDGGNDTSATVFGTETLSAEA